MKIKYQQQLEELCSDLAMLLSQSDFLDDWEADQDVRRLRQFQKLSGSVMSQITAIAGEISHVR